MAIIAVLVAISIPVFTSQLEKSREATDLSNVRSAYTEVMMAALAQDTSAVYTKDGSSIYMSNGDYQIVVQPLKQKQSGWQMQTPLNIGGVSSDAGSPYWFGVPDANGYCKITYHTANDYVSFEWSGRSDSTDGSGSAGDGENNKPSDGSNDKPSDGTEEKPGSGGNTITGKWTDFTIDHIEPFVVGKDGITLKAGTVYTYLGNYYVCIQDTTAGAGWSDYTSVTPNGNKWPYVQLGSNPTILTKDNLNYNDKPTGYFNGVKQGTIYKADDGSLYIQKYDAPGWCDPPEINMGNWQKITK